MSKFDEASETMDKYGFEEAVFILADRWGQSTYMVEKYLKEVEDTFGYSLYSDDYNEPTELEEWADFDPDC